MDLSNPLSEVFAWKILYTALLFECDPFRLAILKHSKIFHSKKLLLSLLS